MKEKMFLGICMVVCLNMFGQANSTEYFPIGTSWQEAYFMIYYDTIRSPIIRSVVTGDTIIEGVKYKCVEETQFDITTNTKVEESEPYRYAIREHGDSIFSRVSGDEERLMCSQGVCPPVSEVPLGAIVDIQHGEIIRSDDFR